MKNIAKWPEKNIHCTLIKSGFVRKQFITLLINIRSWSSHISSNNINIRGKTNSTQLKASNFNKTQMYQETLKEKYMIFLLKQLTNSF